jgi:hypothetical protein
MTIVCKQKCDIKAQSDDKAQIKQEEVIICRACSNMITKPFYRIMINNAFSLTFANPHGQVFEIGNFSKAQGCVSVSDLSSEFTWFPGYSWEIGACTGCAAHLGWIFSKANYDLDHPVQFHGLILDKLIFP